MSTESEIFERARAGDPKAFTVLVSPHVDRLRRLARSFCRDDTEADDLTQEALLKAYRALAGFDGRASLTTWLYTIAKNQYLDHRRSKLFRWRARESEFEDVGESHLPSPDALVEEKEKVCQLWRAVRQIDDKFRIPLVLCEIDGLSYEEAAEIERVPIGTIRSRIARGKARLEEILSVVSGTRADAESSYPIVKGAK